MLPASGPIVICDTNGLPWTGNEYRRKWRKVARHCGIPDNVWNMDSRSGAISEAIAAGAPIEFVRHAAAQRRFSNRGL
jgi:flagellar biosynthesis regulator FlaF